MSRVSPRGWILLFVALAAVAFVVATTGGGASFEEILARKPEFVGSETCKSCHATRHRTWLDTAHAYSLREATEEHVEGRFDGLKIESPYFTATPFRKRDGFYMEVRGKDDRPSGVYKVDRVVGRSFEQAYLYVGEQGEWRVLPLSWSIERKEWDQTHLVLQDISGGDGVPKNYDSRNTIFNHGCGLCHATDYDVGFHVGADGTERYASRFLEGAVACESCHGPGSVHTAWHGKVSGYTKGYRAPARLLQPEKDLDAREILDTCGRCHYRHEWRGAIDPDPRVSHHDVAISSNYDQPGFFADGRIAGLAYHGSTQRWSPCFTKGGMSCLHCHTMHGGGKWAMRFDGRDDAQCADCHGEIVRDKKAHSHHDSLNCVDCHMPKFLTGVLHFMRDHGITIPEPELTERYGADQSPNACSKCHNDHPASWARDWRDKWWGPADRRIVEDVGLVVALRKAAAAQADGKKADLPSVERLAELAMRPEARLFFRLTALQALRALPDPKARAALRSLLKDPDPEVRVLACEAVGARVDPEAIPMLFPLLDDPGRLVRVEAARALVRAGYRGPDPRLERAYADAMKSFERQRPFLSWVDRAAYLAEGIGRTDAFKRHFEDYKKQLPGFGIGLDGRLSAADLVQRRGRIHTEEGEHEAAVELYRQTLLLRNRKSGSLLEYDSAVSLAAIGNTEWALQNLRQIVKRESPGSLPRLLAELEMARPRAGMPASKDEPRRRAAVQKAVERLQKEPALGRWLRRARFALGR